MYHMYVTCILSYDRNKRMFGFIMGTLQKFKETEEAARVSEKVRPGEEEFRAWGRGPWFTSRCVFLR